MRGEVVGRVPGKLFWLRVPYKNAHRILALADEVLPRGLKTATELEIEMSSAITHGTLGFTAKIEVLGGAGADSPEEFSQGS